MKKLKYIFIIFGAMLGVGFEFLDAAISFADTASLDEELNSIFGFDIPDLSLFVFKLVLYTTMGALCGLSVWFLFKYGTLLVKK